MVRAQVCVDLAVGADGALSAAPRTRRSRQQLTLPHGAPRLSAGAGAVSAAARSSARVRSVRRTTSDCDPRAA